MMLTRCVRALGHAGRVRTMSAAAAAAAAAGSSSASSTGAAKLWGGRFTGKTDPLMERFNNSIGFDKRFWRVDIRGSIEYAKALARAGILTHDEAAQIESGLKKVRRTRNVAVGGARQKSESQSRCNTAPLTSICARAPHPLHAGA